MAPKFTLLAVVLAVLVFNVHAQDAEPETLDTQVKCKRFEKFLECGNRCEEPKCVPDGDRQCTTLCQPGCYCKTGRSRNSFGNCVPTLMCMVKNYSG